MGTYTANKNLYMPSVGETGWGTLMNTNLSTIDNFLKPITVSGSTYTFTGNHVGNQSGGSISATSITNSGTLTNTGKITANGGIGTTSLTTSSTITSTGKITGNGGISTKALTATTGTFSGAVTGASFNGVVLKNSGTITVTPTNTIGGYLPLVYGTTYSLTFCMLPLLSGTTKYSGSIKFRNKSTSVTSVYYATDKVDYNTRPYYYATLDIPANSTATLTFTDIEYLYANVYKMGGEVDYYRFTLS